MVKKSFEAGKIHYDNKYGLKQKKWWMWKVVAIWVKMWDIFLTFKISLNIGYLTKIIIMYCAVYKTYLYKMYKNNSTKTKRKEIKV